MEKQQTPKENHRTPKENQGTPKDHLKIDFNTNKKFRPSFNCGFITSKRICSDVF